MTEHSVVGACLQLSKEREHLCKQDGSNKSALTHAQNVRVTRRGKIKMRYLTCQRSRSRFVAGENGCRRRSRCVHVRSTEKLRVAGDPPTEKLFLREEGENQWNIHCHCGSRGHDSKRFLLQLKVLRFFCAVVFCCMQRRGVPFYNSATVHL